jgi:hypothetical protein
MKLPLLNKKDASALITGEPQSYPYLMMGITGKKPQMVGFDTGSPYFLVMAETHAKRYIKDNTFEKLSSGYGSNSRSLLGLQKQDSLYRLRLPSVEISGHLFTNITTETNKSNKTRLGTKLLDQGTVTIDFIHHLFYFEPSTENNNLNEKRWPIKPIVADKKLIVGVVWEKLKDLIKPGDQIMAIDDEPCEIMDLCDWINGKSLSMMKGEAAILSVKDDQGIIKKINITKD